MEFRDEARTCCVIASGPSAGRAELWRTDAWPRLAVNDGWRVIGEPDAIYGADWRWWEANAADLKQAYGVAIFAKCWTQDQRAATDFGLRLIGLERRRGLSHRAGIVAQGGVIGNSGAQALNLAYLWGARRLVLVGFDMKGDHFFGKHPKTWGDSPLATFAREMVYMATELADAGVTVLNTSPDSALGYFKRVPLADALPGTADDEAFARWVEAGRHEHRIEFLRDHDTTEIASGRYGEWLREKWRAERQASST